MAALTTFPTRWFASFVVKERWPCGLAVVSGGVGVNLSKPKPSVKPCLRKYLGMVKIA